MAYPMRPSRGVATRRVTRAAVVGIGLAMLTTACGSGGASAGDGPQPSAPPSAAATPSPSATPDSESALVLAQYRGFWQILTPASRASEQERRRLLAAYAADAALRSLLAGIAAKRRDGQWYYGRNIPRARLQNESLSAGVAVVNDCQDSSRAGLSSISTGRQITVGVARNHVVATLHRMPDGIWRVVFVTYPKTPC